MELTHLRIEHRGEADIGIDVNETDRHDALSSAGSGSSSDPEHERLSAIIERLNERHG